ncbi:hypothetical protein OH77DRAFT_1507574 [Trametes cingulata]|nr:hypothetical protein OH77DRAFT_1507574 [Trametes cingulata]
MPLQRTKRSGVSKGVRMAGPALEGSAQPHAPPVLKTICEKRYGIQAIEEEKRKAAERLAAIKHAMGSESLRGLAEMQGKEVPETFEAEMEDVLVGHHDDDDDWEDVPDPETTSAITHAIRDILQDRVQYRSRKDKRTWQQRVRNLDANWRPLLPQVVEAYLQWKHGSSVNADAAAAPPRGSVPLAEPSANAPALSSSAFYAQDPRAARADQPHVRHDGVESAPSATATPPEPAEYDFEIDVLDVYTKARTVHIKRNAYQTTAEALVLHGYLGTTPITPSLAISLNTLELFRCIRLFKASFSTEAFTKLVCYMYYIPYRRFYRTAIADAFDIYISILREVERQVMQELGRDTPDWRALNACPPCAYRLSDEDQPVFDRILCLDGNNSLKRMAPTAGRATGDPRVFESNYILPREFVNQFAHEVRSRQQQEKPDLPDDSTQEPEDEQPDEAELGLNTTEGDPTDGVPDAITPCASNWKAAAAESNKQMWGIFEETGIFACCCRHGLILWFVDMVRSGELAKYPIAIIKKILMSMPDRLLIGYDIGCTFNETISQSSVGPDFAASRSRFCVNAFHGYSHAYNCQVRYHPNVIKGAGLEDLETLERVFGDSNKLAPITRYCSPYRRHMFCHLFFRQRDAEKYANLGLMLYNNYAQALEIINDQTPVLEEAMRSLGITSEDLAAFNTEECKYFSTLKDEDPADLHLVAYVEALQELRKTSDELTAVSRRFYDRAATAGRSGVNLTFMDPTSGPTDYDADLVSATRKLETSRRYLRERVAQLTAEVNAMEYNEVVKYISERRYQRALGKLQRLVIQRLFELHKLNISRTGYKARTYIAKSLQRRCQAIRNAVNAYNAAARELSPPREVLDWSKASHYAFLEEFALLRDTKNDIRDKPWAKPVVREAMRLANRIARTHEEIQNDNRELRRLHTSIRDEEILFGVVLDDLKIRGIPLAGAVEDYIRHRRAANARNMAYIQRTYNLPGFSGIREPGIRAGAPLPSLLRPSHLESLVSAEVSAVAQDEAPEEQELIDDDDIGGEVSAIIEYLADLTT